MIAFIFPGQGSQQRGMGRALFHKVPEYAAMEQQVDRLLGYSMRELCLKDPWDRLKETQFTQPCIYVVNALHYCDAASRGMRPTHVAGHSLGEYSALLAAGCFDFMTGLRLVQRRGELMARAKNGGMTAVIGLDAPTIERTLHASGIMSIDIAWFNSPAQTVVSGPAEDIARAARVLEKVGATLCIPLEVSAAFHSRYVLEAAEAFADFLAPMSFSAPKVTVVSNVTAQPYPCDDASDAIKSLLVKQITHSVRWTQTIQYLLAQGVDRFEELGPGNVLTTLTEQIRACASASLS